LDAYAAFEFSGPVLCTAIGATFERRKTALPERPPLALTTEFTEGAQKLTQWKAFINKSKLDSEAKTFSQIGEDLTGFLMPPTKALVHGTGFEMDWLPNGPWRFSRGL
jgi:hypothetical protein